MYETVLVPTDGSDETADVAEHAIELAEQFDATVHVLHVVSDRAHRSVPDDVRQRVRETLRADGDDATRAVAQRAVEAGLATVREIRWGNPPASIVAYAAENDVDLVVMGTHGRTGYDRFLLGSVTEKVVRAAPVPVLTVNVGEPSEEIPTVTLPEST